MTRSYPHSLETQPEPISQTDDDHAWKKQLASACTDVEELLGALGLQHETALVDSASDFRCLVPQSYLKKMKVGNINDPLLQQVLPTRNESDPVKQSESLLDPVGDLAAMATPGLLHKYHGRALLITTAACAVHCRYCFRRHFPYQASSCSNNSVDTVLDHLMQDDTIDEIILSGGDPLVLDNNKLEQLIGRLETIPHLDTLRLHTRLPIVLPERINDSLVELLQRSRFDIVMVIHSNHAQELQRVEQLKLEQLHRAGITLLNQSVLLKGVNDNLDSLTALSQRLLACHTLPYYLHMLDPVEGAMHFAVDETDAINLLSQLKETLPGYLVPRLVREIPGNASKTEIFDI